VTRAAFPDGIERSQLSAALDMIAWSEIKPALLAVSDDGYNVLVGSTPAHPILCDSYAQHPHVLNKPFNSTAAGRYQFIYGTWTGIAAQLRLTDFSPVSQDLACVQNLKNCGAYTPLIQGDFDAFLKRASTQWASLPGSNAGQHINAYIDLLNVFTQAGGVSVCKASA